MRRKKTGEGKGGGGEIGNSSEGCEVKKVYSESANTPPSDDQVLFTCNE